MSHSHHHGYQWPSSSSSYPSAPTGSQDGWMPPFISNDNGGASSSSFNAPAAMQYRAATNINEVGISPYEFGARPPNQPWEPVSAGPSVNAPNPNASFAQPPGSTVMPPPANTQMNELRMLHYTPPSPSGAEPPRKLRKTESTSTARSTPTAAMSIPTEATSTPTDATPAAKVVTRISCICGRDYTSAAIYEHLRKACSAEPCERLLVLLYHLELKGQLGCWLRALAAAAAYKLEEGPAPNFALLLPEALPADDILDLATLVPYFTLAHGADGVTRPVKTCAGAAPAPGTLAARMTAGVEAVQRPVFSLPRSQRKGDLKVVDALLQGGGLSVDVLDLHLKTKSVNGTWDKRVGGLLPIPHGAVAIFASATISARYISKRQLQWLEASRATTTVVTEEDLARAAAYAPDRTGAPSAARPSNAPMLLAATSPASTLSPLPHGYNEFAMTPPAGTHPVDAGRAGPSTSTASVPRALKRRRGLLSAAPSPSLSTAPSPLTPLVDGADLSSAASTSHRVTPAHIANSPRVSSPLVRHASAAGSPAVCSGPATSAHASPLRTASPAPATPHHDVPSASSTDMLGGGNETDSVHVWTLEEVVDVLEDAAMWWMCWMAAQVNSGVLTADEAIELDQSLRNLGHGTLQ